MMQHLFFVSLSCLLFVCTAVLRNKGGRDEYDGGETELFVHLEWIRVCAVKETERKSAVKKTKAERQCVGQVFPHIVETECPLKHNKP